MTTPINDFQDILDAIERNPALRESLRRYVLTDELLGLPAQVRVIADAVEALVGETRELRTGQEGISAGQDELRAGLDEVRAGQEGLRTGLNEVRAGLDEVRTGLDEVRTGQEGVRAGLEDVQAEVQHLSGNVANVSGNSYESIAGRIADRLARRYLGVVRPTAVARAKGNDPTPPLPEANTAAESGAITWDESDELALADVVVKATDQDGREIYIVAEISITVQEHDRERALERARILEKASGITTIAAVIGITEEARVIPAGDEPAATADVRFLQFDPARRRTDQQQPNP